MSNKKRKNAILALSIAAVAATTTTVVYFYFRNVLKYMVVKNKVDGSGNPVAIPYSAIDFKNKWENDGLKFDTPVFQTYFEQRFNYKNINSVAKDIKLELSLSDDLQNVILTVTLTKKFGKTETRQFTLIGFTANQKAKELNDFIKNLNIDVNGKNKLPSEVTESNLSPITDPNKDKYDITHKLIPNDETGELKVVTTVTSKEDPNVTKTVEKTIPNFKKDTIPASAVLGYTPKSLIANLMSTHEIENATATLQGGALKAKLEEYGSFDDSLLNGLSYEIRSAKKVSDNNIEELNLTYTVSKQVIIGKNDDNSFKYGTLIEERTIKVSFETAIVSEHNARMQDYVSYVNSKIALKQGYNHNKLASTYDENNDWEIDKTLDSKYFTITFEQVDKSDTNKEVKLRMAVKSKLLATEISSQANLTLLDFFEDKPTKKLSVTAKNDGYVTNLDDYLAPNKYKDITENINYPSDNGWTLKDNSITVQKDPLDEKTLIFNYVVEKNVVESSLSATTQLLSHNGQAKVSYASIINKNKGDEFSKLLANIVIGYQGTKPRIDKVDNSKFTVDYKAPFTATDFPNYEIVGVDTSSIKFNYKDGKLFIKATIKDKKTNTITSSEMELVDGFLPFTITDDNLLKGTLKTNLSDVHTMQQVLDKFTNKTDPDQVFNVLQTMLDNFVKPTADVTNHRLEIVDLKTNGNKLVLKYKIIATIPANDAPTDNKTTEIEREDTKEFDFTNVFKKQIDDVISSLTFDFSDEVKANATTTLPSEVAANISSFKVTSSDASFNQNDYDWEVELNPNNVKGKLFARITMISKQDPTIKKSIVLNNLSTQFKTYQTGQIENATAKNNISETSTLDIINKIITSSNPANEMIKKYVDYTYNGDDTIEFIKNPMNFKRIGLYKIEIEYQIDRLLNDPNNFEDTTTQSHVTNMKKFIVDFETQIKAKINEKLEELKNSLTLDVTNKSRLASTVIESDITATPTIPSDYELVYSLLDPNDKNGTLTITAILKHRETNIEVTKIVTLNGFNLDGISSSNVLKYTAKSAINDLMSTHEIEDATSGLQDALLKAKIEEYGIFDDSQLTNITYKIDHAKKANANNIEELVLTYTLTKQIIVKKNADNTYVKENVVVTKTINVSFATPIVANHNTKIQQYVAYAQSRVATYDGYNHDKLASTYNENSDWTLTNTLDSKYFDLSFANTDKSDINKDVKIDLVIKTKLLQLQIVSTTNLTLRNFKEDAPTKQLSVTAKNDGKITNLDDYLSGDKYKDITENINYPSDNGWTLKDNSITVTKNPANKYELIFHYTVQKDAILSSAASTTQHIEYAKEVIVSFTDIIINNKNKEFNNLKANLQIDYQTPKPRIDMINNSSFTFTLKSPYTWADFPNYEVIGIEASTRKLNYKTGTALVRAEIKDKASGSIFYSDYQQVTGFDPYQITNDNLLKGNLKTDIPNISSMQDVLDKFSNKTDAWQILSDLQTMLDNYSAPNAAHTFSLTNPSLTTNGNKLIFKYTMNVNVPINDAPSDNKTGIISKEDTKEFDFTNILKKNLDKDFATLTFDLANSVKSTATTTFASEVAKAMSSFTVTSSQAGFDQNKYDWLVETNPNDVDGKLFARITMISKQDSTIRNSITLNSIPTQFKVYIPTQIASATAKNNLNVTSAQEILDKVLAASDKDAEVRKYIDYVYAGDETIKFSEQASDYSINGYKVKFGYIIFKQLNRASSFEDSHHPYTSSAQKNIEVDFEAQIKARISENIDSLLNDLTFDITNKSKLASTVTDANITTTSAALPSGYQLSYYWLDPNDKTGKLKVHAKITHVGSNISKEKEVEFSNFKKDDTFGFTYGISYDITYLESIMNQVLTNFANGNQTQKLANMRLFFKYDSTVVDSNITSKTLSYDTTSKVATYVFDYKKKVVTSRAQNGTLGYEEITFQNQTMSRSFYNFFEIMRWQNTFTVCAYCLNSRGRGPLCEEADGYRYWLYAQLNKGTSDTQLASILATHKSNALNYLPRYKAINRHDGYENQHSHRPELQPNYYFQYTA